MSFLRSFTTMASRTSPAYTMLRPRTSRPPTSSSFFTSSHTASRPGMALSSLRRAFSSGPSSFSQNAKTNMNILYGAIGLNCGVFAYYLYLRQQASQGAPKPLMKFVTNFTLNLNQFKDGRWWTALTSCVTHFGPMHLLGNMLSVYFMGQLLAYTPAVTPFRLITLIVGSGLSGSLGYLYTRLEAVKRTRGYDNRRAIGFSGAVMGVGAAAACMYPKTTFLIYGIVPMPLWALMGGYFLYDGYFVGSEATGTAHAGHLGGLAFGLVYYFARLRGLRI